MHLTRTICCKLAVDDQDLPTLAATARAFNAAATWVAQVCWDEGLTNTNTAHHRVYGETRTRFGLGAQLAICARMKAVEAIKAVKARRRETCPRFGPRGSGRYDARSYTLMGHERVSLNTLDGRITCRLILGEASVCAAARLCLGNRRGGPGLAAGRLLSAHYPESGSPQPSTRPAREWHAWGGPGDRQPGDG
jgi:predicted transposase